MVHLKIGHDLAALGLILGEAVNMHLVRTAMARTSDPVTGEPFARARPRRSHGDEFADPGESRRTAITTASPMSSSSRSTNS